MLTLPSPFPLCCLSVGAAGVTGDAAVPQPCAPVTPQWSWILWCVSFGGNILRCALFYRTVCPVSLGGILWHLLWRIMLCVLLGVLLWCGRQHASSSVVCAAFLGHVDVPVAGYREPPVGVSVGTHRHLWRATKSRGWRGLRPHTFHTGNKPTFQMPRPYFIMLDEDMRSVSQ